MNLLDEKWNRRYLEMARLVSTWSKDPSTRVGAVAVGADGRILSTGYNGFPRGIADDSRYDDRQQKYGLIVHAEMNCIYNAAYLGSASLKGSSIYVYGLPVCHECCKGIIQAGFFRIVLEKIIIDNLPANWKESWNRSSIMLEEAGITCEFVDIQKPL